MANDILCVTACLNEELLCMQNDNLKNILAVARDKEHMQALIQELGKHIPIDMTAVRLEGHREADILVFIDATEEIGGIAFFADQQIAIVERERVLEFGISPFTYYNVETEPVCFEEEEKEQFFVTYNGENLFKVTFGGVKNLLLIAKTAEEMNTLASFVYSDAPTNFENVVDLSCEKMPIDQVMEIIKTKNVEGILFVNDHQELATVTKENVVKFGLSHCFSA